MGEKWLEGLGWREARQRGQGNGLIQGSESNGQRVRAEARGWWRALSPHSAGFGPENNFHSAFEMGKVTIFSGHSLDLVLFCLLG